LNPPRRDKGGLGEGCNSAAVGANARGAARKLPSTPGGLDGENRGGPMVWDTAGCAELSPQHERCRGDRVVRVTDCNWAHEGEPADESEHATGHAGEDIVTGDRGGTEGEVRRGDCAPRL
jgi:hypothetical protein